MSNEDRDFQLVGSPFPLDPRWIRVVVVLVVDLSQILVAGGRGSGGRRSWSW